MAKAKASNVVDLADFRPRKAPLPPQQPQQEEPPLEEWWWPHTHWARWCLLQYDNRPEIAAIVNDWELEFLESVAEWDRPATERQQRCLHRIALRIDRLVSGSASPASSA
jgi:hypothetical protein